MPNTATEPEVVDFCREFAGMVVNNRDSIAGESADEKLTRARAAFAILNGAELRA